MLLAVYLHPIGGFTARHRHFSPHPLMSQGPPTPIHLDYDAFPETDGVRVTAPGPPLAKPSFSRPGDVNAYELRREIARGGMGVVYEARHRHLGRVVALKLMRGANFAGPEEVARFRAETEAVARLDHPGIVPIYDVGEIDGTPFFTMKLIEGGSLAEQVTRGPMRQRDAARIIARVARAVHHAHQRGVLHRDIKPGNILVDDQGEPYLTDFGVAKFSDHETGLTMPGDLLGTTEYMAPEQTRGEVQALTTACDVWSLGVVLYQLLSGRLPFAGASQLKIVQAIVQEEPESLCGAAFRTQRGAGAATQSTGARSSVDRDLATIVARCLEKDAARRMPGADFLARELESWLAGEPIRSRHVTTAERVWKWVRRHPLRVATAAVVMVSILAGSVTSFILWQKARAANVSLNSANVSLNSANVSLNSVNSSLQQTNEQLARSLRIATANRLASESRGLVNDAPALGLVLAAESAELSRAVDGTVLPQAAGALYYALQNAGGLDASPTTEWKNGVPSPLKRNLMSAVGMRQSPDGRWFLTLMQNAGGIQAGLFDGGLPLRAEARRRWTVGPRTTTLSLDACWTADSRSILTVDGAGEVRLWDVNALAATDSPLPAPRLLGRVGLSGRAPNCPRFVRNQDGLSLLVTSHSEQATALCWHRIDLTAETPLAAPVVIADTEKNAWGNGIHVSAEGRWALRAGPYHEGAPALIQMGAGGAPPTQIELPDGPHNVDGVDFSADEKWVAFGRRDGVVRLYDLAAGDAAAIASSGRGIFRRKTECLGVAFSPNGKWLALTGNDSVAQLIALDGSRPAAEFRVSSSTALGVTFSPNSEWLAIGNAERIINVWPVAALHTARPLQFRGLPGTGSEVAFSADGRVLCAHSFNGTCRRWEFNGNNSGAQPLVAGESVSDTLSAAVSPDGRWIATASDTFSGHDRGDAPIQIFDTVRNLARHEIPGHRNPSGVAMSGDGRWLASAGRDGTIKVWKLPELTAALESGGKPPAPLSLRVTGTREQFHRRLAFHPKGRLYGTCGDGLFFEWDLTAPDPAATFKQRVLNTILYLLPDVAVSPDGRWLAVARHGYDDAPRPGFTQYGNLVLLFDATDPENLVLRHELRSHHLNYAKLAFSPDSRWLAASSQDHPADLWDVSAADIPGSVRRSPVYVSRMLGVSFAPAGNGISDTLLALGASNGEVYLWDYLKGPNSLRTIESLDPVYTANFLPDGRLVTGGRYGRIRLWETNPNKLVELARKTAGRELSATERERFFGQ